MASSHLPITLAAILSASSFANLATANPSNNWVCQMDAEDGWDCAVKPEEAGLYKKPPLPFNRKQTNTALLAEGLETSSLNTTNANVKNLDWYPKAALLPEQSSKVPRYCEGTYIEPDNDSPTAGQEFDTAALTASANSSKMKQNQQATFSGDVYIAKGDLRIYADEASLDQSTDTLTLDGNVILRDNGLLMIGETATMDTTNSTGQLENATYLLHPAHMRGEAETLERPSKNITNLTKSSITRCAPNSNAWSIKASTIELNQETGMGTATHAVVKIQDVPILYTPYITYPIDGKRRTGFLWPSIASGDEGIDVTVPFYINIAPNWDATLAPRYIADRGTATELEGRHLNRYSDWVISTGYIEDELYDGSRWIGSVDEFGRIGQSWWHRVDYTEVSDNDFFNDLGADSLSVKRTVNLLQQASMGYQSDDWVFTTSFTQYQTLDETIAEQYKILPEMSFYFRPDYEDFKITGLFSSHLANFDIKNTNRSKGTRLYVEPGISYPMNWAGGFLTPTAKIKNVAYDLDDTNILPNENENNASASVPMFSLDGGMYFDRDSNWFDTEYNHSLEPHLYYLYSEFEDQSDQPIFDTGQRTFDYNQLFRESKFTSYDRLDDANQITLGITTRFTEKQTGRESFIASIGQIYYFEDRKVTTSGAVLEEHSSEIATELVWQPIENLRNKVSILYNHREHYVRRGSYKLTYHVPNGIIVNAGANYAYGTESIDGTTGETIDSTTRQTNFSTILPIGNHWSAIAKINYDHTNERELEQVAGLVYESCCWKASVVYQEGVDINNETDRGLFIEFVLKGLGGSGNKINSLLSDSIEGYRERDDYGF